MQIIKVTLLFCPFVVAVDDVCRMRKAEPRDEYSILKFYKDALSAAGNPELNAVDTSELLLNDIDIFTYGHKDDINARQIGFLQRTPKPILESNIIAPQIPNTIRIIVRSGEYQATQTEHILECLRNVFNGPGTEPNVGKIRSLIRFKNFFTND